MKRALLFFVLALCVAAFTWHAVQGSEEPLLPPGPQASGLCSVLEGIQPGQRISVIVSGIYNVGSELQFLYDPNQPVCEKDVQPSTWIELSPDLSGRKLLDELIQKFRRAAVVFEGDFYGPGLVGMDDLKASPNISYIQRVAGRRYGHLGAFRTKLVVRSVLRANEVPPSTPWAGEWSRSPDSALTPILTHAAIPRYPESARRAGISGVVELELSVAAGTVVSVELLSGDRALAEDAVKNANTWRFDTATNGKFPATFFFFLELRDRGASDAVDVSFHSPLTVTIKAPSFAW